MERSERNLFGSISKIREKTFFYNPTFREKREGTVMNSNRRWSLAGICHGDSI